MPITLLLLGKTGVGKSATGNSILGRKAFNFGGTTSSVTFSSKKDISDFDGLQVEVVDTPGVADTGYSEEDGKKMFMGAITQAIAMSPYGYHALIYTLKYGNRLTKEDVDVFKYLKLQFGETFLMRHGIVIMTCGDQFEDEEEEERGLTFPQWCSQQGGHFQSIFQAVNGRIVLFDNHRRCPEEKKVTQRHKLLQLVMSIGQMPYTNEDFGKAQQEYKKLLRTVASLRDDIRNECSLVLAKYEYIVNRNSSVREKVSGVRNLQPRLLRLLQEINNEEVRHNLLDRVKQLVIEALQSVQREPLNFDIAKQEIARLQADFKEIRDQSNINIFGRIFESIKFQVRRFIDRFRD